MGAHSLGRVHIEISGFGFINDSINPLILNAWDNTPHVLDNDYFVKLVDIVSVENQGKCVVAQYI